AAEEAVKEGVPRLAAAQETWYSLAALRARIASTLTIARERMRQAEDEPSELLVVGDPDDLEREAARVAAQEKEVDGQRGYRATALQAATTHRSACEGAERAEEDRLAALIRAAADRREGLARLNGQVNSLRSRGEAAEAEISRLTTAQRQATERAEQASRAFTVLET